MLSSHAYPRAPPPSCFAVSSAFAPSRAQSATLAPAAANAWQISRPMPRVPPVTSATFPGSSIFTTSHPEGCARLTLSLRTMNPSCGVHESGHFLRRPKADHVRPRDDPLQETGQHGAGTDLDKSGAFATDACRMLHALHPANGRRQLIRQQSTRADRLLHCFGGGVRDHREGGIDELGALERELQMVLGRSHERRVECAADVERNDEIGRASCR